MKFSELNDICPPLKQTYIHEFADYCCKQLGIEKPKLSLSNTNDTSALGYTDMSDGSVTIVVADRHQMDIMRTLAHELVHCKQMKSYEPDGATGSKDENEANAMAGVLMREWGQNNPDLFTEGANVPENTDEARLSMKKKRPSPQDRFNKRLKKNGIDLGANQAEYKRMMDKLRSIDSGLPKKESVEQVEEAAEHKLLQKSKLSSDEYQQAKKLTGFVKSYYKWNPDEHLYQHKFYGKPPKPMDQMAKKPRPKTLSDKEKKQYADIARRIAATKRKEMRGEIPTYDRDQYVEEVEQVDESKTARMNVQQLKEDFMGAVRSDNPSEMKRISESIGKRISDLMDLRGTAGKEVDAQIQETLHVLKKAQMMLRDKKKVAEGNVVQFRQKAQDASFELNTEIHQHAELHAIRGKDLEKYVGKTVTLWTEGSSNPPTQQTYKIEAGKNSQGVTIEGTYYGPKEFVTHNSAEDYSWKSESAAQLYSEMVDSDDGEEDYVDEAKKKKSRKKKKAQKTTKKDACYHKVRSRYDVWPSAYASGALVQCRKKGAKNWGNSGKK